MSEYGRTDQHRRESPADAYPKYTLILLTLCYAFSIVDKQLLVIVQESVKRDFQLSDTQLGLLTGFAFSALYAAASIPLARIADRSGRRNVIAVTTVVWSLLTTAAGVVTNVTQLFLVRMGVAVGEAGCSPAATALIADHFPEEQRTTALSFYWMVGAGIGVLVAFIGGGLINEMYGWRYAFLLLGAPGVVLALAVGLTLREPARARKSSGETDYRFVDCMRFLAVEPTLRLLLIAGTLSYFAASGALNWSVSLLSRSFAVPTSSSGLFLALSYGIGGTVASLAIGRLADRLGARDRRWQIWLLAIDMLVMGLLMAGAYLATTPATALILLAPVLALASVFVGIVFSLVSTLTPVNMRATISSIFISTFNLGGLGLGGAIVGMLSDHLAPAWGNDSLRIALLMAMPAVSLMAALIYFLTSFTVSGEIPKVANADSPTTSEASAHA
ncbi:spinster family MFS transporter [Rhizorhabdus dicambivorans]|nr:MFS transporter [Rhizorhabdus dicambivorans]